MHYYIDPIESPFEENFVCFKFQRVRHNTCRIREHAVLRYNCITFNAMQLEHSAASCPLCSSSNVTPNLNWVEILVKLSRSKRRSQSGPRCCYGVS